MAKQVIVKLTDDIDGSEADETVSFSINGKDLEIDLSSKNATAMRKALEKYVAAARKPESDGRRRPRQQQTSSSTSKEELQAMRDWARANGFTVSDRGRVSQEIRDAFAAAQN